MTLYTGGSNNPEGGHVGICVYRLDFIRLTNKDFSEETQIFSDPAGLSSRQTVREEVINGRHSHYAFKITKDGYRSAFFWVPAHVGIKVRSR